MNPEEWARVKVILIACLELEPDERKAHLDRMCAGNSELRVEVERFLASYSEAGEGFLETSLPETPVEILTGRQIGLYQIGELIGEGGMGAVYRAARASDFRKQVAVKLVKRGMDTDFILRRFRQERQILAALDHPNIARLLDGGATEDGRPYLVMEYIEGTPITQYCDDHRLGESERLELFRTVCSAVQYAHQNLVVHRDLKPRNILVTADGAPKLLDFGIAKLLEPDADATMTSIRMLSPECASPEQVLGQAITTASDVYSLGVLLYLLLSGEPPYRFTTRTAAEVTRVVCEAEPRRPSDVRPVHADLDNIALKAMRKDPARRYVSAEQLSEDVRRYLARLPVIARKDTVVYRLSKFVWRHTAASIAAGLAVISLLGGLAATLWQAHRSAVQQEITNAVNDFLRNDLLAQAGASKQAGPDTKPDQDLRVRTALDRAAARIERKFGAQPLVEASIRQTIGDAYEDLGLYREAQRHVERAVDLRRRALGEKDPDTLESMNSLAGLLGDQGRYREAEPLQSKVLELRRRVLGEQHPDTLTSMDGLANADKHLGRFAEAETLQSRALAMRRRSLGEGHPDTLVSMNDLATIYEDEGKLAQAEPLYVRADEIRRRVLGEEHPDTLIGMNNLASLYSHLGMYAKAETLQSRVLELRRRVLGEEHPLTLTSMSNLAVEYARDSKYELAEPILTAVLEARRRVLGDGNPDTLLSVNNLAGLYRRQGKYAQAEPLYRQALEIQTRVLGENHPYTLISTNNLAELYRAEGEYGKAEPLYIKALAGRRRVLGPEHPDTLRTLRSLARLYIDDANYAHAEAQARVALSIFEKTISVGWERYDSQSLVGASLAGQKKYSEAEPLLLAGYEGMAQRRASIPPVDRPGLDQAGQWIVQLYQDWRKQDKAAEWRQRLQKTQPAVRVR
jgi:tetratricopeptide (TPR) repeat protein